MHYPHFDPYVFGLHWGSFGIRWYALAYVAGILLGWWYGIRLSRKDEAWGARAPIMTRDQVDDLVLWVTLGVIVGGRVGSMVFYNTAALWKTPLEIFKIWNGGMSFHGGLIGVAIAMVLFARFQKLRLFAISDLVAPAVPIGLFFGRIANFVNGELWGRETSLPWGFYVNPDDPLPRHPSQLYEATLEGIVLFTILWFATRRWGQLKRPGAVTGLFLIFYGIFRFVVEFVRAPDEGFEHLPLGLTMGQYLSAPMILIGLWLFFRAKVQSEPIAAPAPQPAPKARKTPAKPKAKVKAKPKA